MDVANVLLKSGKGVTAGKQCCNKGRNEVRDMIEGRKDGDQQRSLPFFILFLFCRCVNMAIVYSIW